MSALSLLRELQQRDVRLRRDGQYLLIDAPEHLLTPELISKVAEHKTELIAALGPAPSNDIGPPDDVLSNHLRGELLLWGAPLGWPSLVEVGLSQGGQSWTEWLWVASPSLLAEALAIAHRPDSKETKP